MVGLILFWVLSLLISFVLCDACVDNKHYWRAMFCFYAAYVIGVFSTLS